MLSNAYGMFYVAKSTVTNAVLAHMYCVYTALCGYVLFMIIFFSFNQVEFWYYYLYTATDDQHVSAVI